MDLLMNRRDVLLLFSTVFLMPLTKIIGKESSLTGILLEYNENPSTVFITNLSSNLIRQISTTTKVHSFCYSKTLGDLFLGIEKQGLNASFFSLSKAKEVKRILPPKGHVFYGHAEVLDDHGVVLFTTVRNIDQMGCVASYDIKANNWGEIIDVTPGGVHDILKTNKDNLLAMTSRGLDNEKSSVILLDFKSQKISERIYVQEDRFKATHLNLIERELIVISADKFLNRPDKKNDSGGKLFSIELESKNKKLIEWTYPSNIKTENELLSSAYITSTNELVVTNPVGNKNLFYNFKNRKFLRAENKRTFGVTSYQDHFIFSEKNGAHSKIIYV